MAASSATLFVTGGIHSGRYNPLSNKLRLSSGYQSQLAFCQNSKQSSCRRYMSVHAEYSDGSRGGGGDFLAGFLLGGAIFGTLAYVFAPQANAFFIALLPYAGFYNQEFNHPTRSFIESLYEIRRSILNEDESGFRKAKQPIYYNDEGLEKTRQMLNAKIGQLNSAIDNVSSRLRGGNNVAAEPIEAEPEVEASM